MSYGLLRRAATAAMVLMVEAESNSETSVNLYQATQLRSSEEINLRIHRRENLKFQKKILKL